MKIIGAWYAFHTIVEMESVHGLVTNQDLQTYIINFPPMKFPDHQSLTPSVSMATPL